jgi:hypothetical protein
VFIEFPDMICYQREDVFAFAYVRSRWKEKDAR